MKALDLWINRLGSVLSTSLDILSIFLTVLAIIFLAGFSIGFLYVCLTTIGEVL